MGHFENRYSSGGKGVNPLLYRIRKNYLGPEGEIVTGPNYSKQYKIPVNIAPGQTISNLVIQDNLPNNLQYTGNNNPGGTLVANVGTASGSANLNFDFFIPLLDQTNANVINPNTGNAVTSTDVATVNPNLVWNPLDTRDSQPSTLVETPATHTLIDRSIAIQKTWSEVLGGDNNALGLSPGDVIEYTLNFQVSDYFAFGNVKLHDMFSKGQEFDNSFTPTFTINEHNVVSSGSFGLSFFSVTNPVSNSNGTVDFNLSSQLLSTLPSQLNPTDKLLGGFIDDNGGYLNSSSFGATTGQIKFRTVIQENFTGSFPDQSVDNGDFFRNDVTITGDVLDVNSFNPTGFNESDSGVTAFLLPRGKFNDTTVGQGDGYEVSVYQIKDNAGNVKTGTTVAEGDEVTYRIKYTLPFADIENLQFQSELPFPVFDVGNLNTSGVSVGSPALNQIVYGPMDTLHTFYGSLNPLFTGPNLSINGANNFLTINYGTFDDPTTLGPGSNGPVTIDLLYTLKVGNQVTANNLVLNNLVYEREGSTNAGSRQFLKFAQLTLAQPDLKITKGVVATSEDKAVFSKFFPVIGNNPPRIEFTDPGTAGVRFSGRIDSTTLSTTNYFDSDVTADLSDATGNNGTTDLVTYAIILENIGTSPNGAFDVLIRDTLPTGFNIPTGGLNLQVTDGTRNPIGYTGSLFGSGIQLVDSGTGAIADYNATSGDNVVVITFDLEVDDNLANETIITNTAILEEYSSSEGGAKFLPGSQSLTDEAKVKTQPYLQEQFEAFLDSFSGNIGNQVFTPLDYLGGDKLKYDLVWDGPGLAPFSPYPANSISLNDLSFTFNQSFDTEWGIHTINVQISDSDTNNNSGGISYDVEDDFTFDIGIDGTVTNNHIVNSTVFFDTNLNGELDANEPFTTTDAQGNFNFTNDLLIYDTNGDGTLDISEGQIVSLGGINTATGLVQDTALIASPDASVVTPLTTVIAELMGRGLTQTQANDLLTSAFSIPNTVDINNFDPVVAVNNSQAGAVAAYVAHTQVAILISQAATIVSHFSNASPSQILDNVVGAIANRIQTGLPLDLTNPTHLESIITNGAAIPSGNTNLVQGLAQIIAAANQSLEDFANTLPIASLEEQFAKVEKVALGETKQDIKDVLNSNKTIAQAIAENTGTALQNQINTALIFSADPIDISLTNTSVAESKPIGTTIGILSSVDSELGETYTYSLVRGEGDPDNNLFEIVGNTLKTKASFDYETKNSYNIRVQTSDGNGGIFWKEFTIDVTDVNETVEIVGTEKADTLFGTPGDDTIYGLGGNDTIYADEGDNIVYGGNGSDKIYAGNGDDVIDAGDGNDTIYANEGDNTIYGGAGIDTIYTGNGDDFIDAGDGNDTIYANEGNNTIDGGAGHDLIYAGNGDDIINGGLGNDTIYANGGDNIINGGLGNNTIWLGDGLDTVILELGSGFNTINNFQLDQTTFQLGSGLTTDDISIFNRANGAEIYAGSDRLAVVSWTQASVIQNNLSTIFI